MALTLEHVSVVRGGRTVLNDVSAMFEPGRVTVILGPNGAGKSTLLQVAAGLLRSEGRVLLDGEDIARMPADARARAIGYLPQEASVHWDMTVEDVVALGRLPHRDRNEATIERAMARTDTAAFAKRRIGTLSGGERSRVLLARVLAGEPRWVLADEPLAYLDALHASDMLRRLQRVASAGAGVVMILHDLTLVTATVDDAILLKNGGCSGRGPASEILTTGLLEAVFETRIVIVDIHGQRRFIVA